MTRRSAVSFVPLVAILAACAGVCVACRGRVAERLSDEAAISTRGPIRFAEIERFLRMRGEGATNPGTESLLDRYRRAAEEIAVRQALLPVPEELDLAAEALGPEREKIRRFAVGRVYLQARLPPIPLPGEDELRAEFDAQQKRFSHPAQRVVSHILLRPDAARDEEATVALARSLREQVEAGASFRDLARRYSQSETRSLGGRLGVIEKGQLPPALESVVFALADGETSDPLRSRDGVMLFHVTGAAQERRFEFDEVRAILRTDLLERRRAEAVHEIAQRAPTVESDKILEPEALKRAIALGEEEVVLRVDGLEWTLGEILKDLRERPADPGTANRDPLDRLGQAYAQLADLVRVERLARDEGFEATEASAITALEQGLLNERLYRAELAERMKRMVDETPADVERFFRDNAYLYVTPLQLRIRTLSVPLGADPGARLREIEALRAEAQHGRANLEAIAATVGGEILRTERLSIADLERLEPKVHHYLLDMKSTGFSIPFQLNRRILMIEVLERTEPAVQKLEKVADRVRNDYLERNKQTLYRRVAQKALRDVDFRFHEEAVRERLEVPTASSPD